MESELICRKQIARRLGITVDFLRKHEDQLGFGEARVYLGKRCVRFQRKLVEKNPLFLRPQGHP